MSPRDPEISVVIPVYNEEQSLPELHRRLDAALRSIGRGYEILYVDDGSSDGGLALLLDLQRRQPDVVQVVELFRNYGQFNAILAGFERVRGGIVLTLDADLQNPPEEIPRLVAKLDEGYDVVNGWRRDRQDSAFRRWASRLANAIAARTTGVKVRDYGCMLRAHRREIVDQVVACREQSSYLPTLANALAGRVAELEVAHAERAAGRSKYPFWKLIDLEYDMLTSFSVLPLRMISLLGAVVATAACLAGLWVMVRPWLAAAPPGRGGGLAALLFLLIGLLFLALGLVGEYVGRIHNEIRMRPRFVVRRVHGATDVAAALPLERGRGAARTHPVI
jgi:undecaprenyl-phosphate 4-deoxy-4-formamido-L-arabinose transferase